MNEQTPLLKSESERENEREREDRARMEGDDKKQQQTVTCGVVKVDHSTNFCYRVCSLCERSLPESSPPLCSACDRSNPFNPGSSGSKLLFRLLISVASDTKVFVVICFDRAARVLFGCSADEFFHFARFHPLAAATAAQILEGEMFRMTLAQSKSGNAQHMRLVSVVPLRSGYQPVMNSLRQLYGAKVGTS